MSEPHAVYRHFDDVGQLLYVGCSMNVFARTLSHKDKSWFHDIVTITVEWFPSVIEASQEEARAIFVYNKRGCKPVAQIPPPPKSPKPRWPSIPDKVVRDGAALWHNPDIYTEAAALKVFHDAGFPWVKRHTLNDNLGTRSAPKSKEGE